jgi:Zn2+/Cd2+-exporting ATPase
MGSNEKTELLIRGLDCANCSAKIERDVNKLYGIKSASLNFTNKVLTIKTEKSSNKEQIFSNIKLIVKKHEPDAKVILRNECNEFEEDISQNEVHEISKLSLGVILFVMAFLSKDISIKLLLFLASCIISGSKVIIKALKNISNGLILDENFLMSAAAIGAFSIGQYAEGAAVMLLYSAGEFLQNLAVYKSRKSITSLLSIRPDYANLKVSDKIIKVSPKSLNIGDMIIVKPGERVPVDGIIMEGTSMFDTSAITGEYIPRRVAAGGEALSGFINKNGLIMIKVTRKFEQSTATRIIEMVENAAASKTLTENFITKCARYYTPIVVSISVLIAVIPTFIMSGAGFYIWFYRALIFLVVSCPCALIISIPLSFFCGIGGASKKGILIKGSSYMETLSNAREVVFDKTGTLTKGMFKVKDIVCRSNFSRHDLLKYAAFAEAFSNHPVAASIINAYDGKITKSEVYEYTEIPGLGVRAIVFGNKVIVGNTKLMLNNGIKPDNYDASGTVVHVAVNNIYKGYILISDEIKEDAYYTISTLRENGINRIIMFTGDSSENGKMVSDELKLDFFYSELLPYQKLEKLESMLENKKKNDKIIFVGDGINDAPVLARADVGVAMGTGGSDAAIEAADIILMTDEPQKLVTAIKIAKKTKKIVWQNIIFVLGIKIAILILGAVGEATIWEAVFADAGVALISVINSLRAMNI